MNVKEILELESGFSFEITTTLFTIKTKQKMKTIKNLALMFIATIIAMNVNAQATKTSAKEGAKPKTETKAESKTSSAKPATKK